MTPGDQDEVRRRQKSRAAVMGVLLAIFAALMFAITIAKMTVNQ